MIYNEKLFKLNDGSFAIAKSPKVVDARKLINNIIRVAESTHELLSEPEDFKPFLEDITKEEKFIESFNNNQNYLICVYVNDEIIGNCALNFKTHLKDKHRATVGIAIEKEYQDKGIGSFLFDEMINIAKNTEGVEQLELDVAKTNERAKHLYSKKGFVKVGDLPHELKLSDGSYIDGEKMVLFLNN
ncbi:MAG: GNAT family N-acetyltransferase [Acholeplasmatales bacterium]|nr:GNAT family N-acetyltransferase [Acholeplasmatales bacterium]